MDIPNGNGLAPLLILVIVFYVIVGLALIGGVTLIILGIRLIKKSHLQQNNPDPQNHQIKVENRKAITMIVIGGIILFFGIRMLFGL